MINKMQLIMQHAKRVHVHIVYNRVVSRSKVVSATVAQSL